MKTITLSKPPALDPQPVKKSGRERFPFLQVQLQCKLVRHVQNSSFSSFFGESKIGQSTQTWCTIALGQSRKGFKSLGTLLAHKLTVVFWCLGAGRDTGCLCQPAQQAMPTSSWDGGHVSPDQYPGTSPLLLAALLILFCQRLRVLKTGFVSRVTGMTTESVVLNALMIMYGKTDWMTYSDFSC